jgi:hypothetical protein
MERPNSSPVWSDSAPALSRSQEFLTISEIFSYYFLSFASFATLRELDFFLLRVLSNQEESTGSFRQFFAGQQMSYYGGPELPEAHKALPRELYVLRRRKNLGSIS